jgi:predicted transcriptional regulator
MPGDWPPGEGETVNRNPIIIFMQWIDETLFATAGKISPWLMPIPSGLILGWTFGVNMVDSWGGDVARFAGYCATAGVVGLGAYASHNAVKRGGMWWWLVAGHAVLVIASLVVLNAAIHIKGIGVILELMTVLSYVAQAGARQTEMERQQAEAEAAEEKRRQSEVEAQRLEVERREAERLATIDAQRLRLEHEERMAKIEADKQTKIARASVQKSVQKSVQPDTREVPKEAGPDEQKSAIVKAVSSGETVNWSKLADSLNISRGTIYNRRKELIEQGFIHEIDGQFVTNGKQFDGANS